MKIKEERRTLRKSMEKVEAGTGGISESGLQPQVTTSSGEDTNPR
jgi:hypothetical protein